MLAPAFAYFAIVFGAGFVLGTLRVLAIAPRVGEHWAVALELPVMLAISWWACGFVVRRQHVPSQSAQRLAMGGLAFAMLIGAEIALALAIGEWRGLSGYREPAKLMGLAGQLVFALIPLLRRA